MLGGGWPQVQLALDFVRIQDALRIAKVGVDAGIGWLEAGTPLIKSEGMASVRTLRRTFPRQTIVADMKTLDAGTVETELAFRSGANVVSISALANDRTIRDSVRNSRNHNGKIMTDLLMSPSPLQRAKELERLGVDLVCVHTGIDTQKSSGAGLKLDGSLRSMTRILKIPIAAAGGVNPDTARELATAGISLIIVGGWITRSKNPEKASRQIVENVRLSQEP